MIATDTISLHTKGFTDVFDISESVAKIVKQSGIQNGQVNVFCSGSMMKILLLMRRKDILSSSSP